MAKKYAKWTSILLHGAPSPFALRAGKKGHGAWLDSPYDAAYDQAMPLKARCALIETRAQALGYTIEDAMPAAGEET